jgi:hypothetical protein
MLHVSAITAIIKQNLSQKLIKEEKYCKDFA